MCNGIELRTCLMRINLPIWLRTLLCQVLRRRPPLLVVKNFLTRLGFSGGFTVGELFTNNFLINFEQDEDYQRFFYRKVWTIGKDTMSVTKWSLTLTQEEDSPIVPVWISIPNLPIHLHHQSALFSIASMLGTPLKMDNATLNFSRPKLARVCVEVDVSKTLHQRIHVKHNDTDLFFQEKFILLDHFEQNQVSHFIMKVFQDDSTFVLSGVYGGHSVVCRKGLWEEIKTFNNSNSLPWLIGGDFNAILDILHHHGKKLPDLESVEDFNSCIKDCNLLESNFTGPVYTWHGTRSNGNVWRRLDRIFFNDRWNNLWTDISMKHLSKQGSDHSPILISSKTSATSAPKSFRFQNMWLLNKDFKNLCKSWWLEIPYYGGMKCLFHKLSHLKSKIASWNKEQFGNIFDLLKEAEEEASTAEINYEREPTEANREIVNLKKAQLLQVGNLEHSYWKQKCNLKWLKEGDANTKFFHNLVKERRRQQKIMGLKDDQGKFQENPTVLENMVTSHYHKRFNYEEPAPSSQDYDAFLSNTPKILDQHHNQELLHLPSEDEVKATLFDMEANCCAGPDGFNVNFFKECWEIVHKEVTSACQEVFLGIPLPVAAASTNICLIPKCENASRLNDFRPVCLSTVASKIATKCVARRLSKVLPLIISEEQGAFVAGRDIMVEQILLTKEMAHNIDTKAESGNIIIKLDMAKAFDKLKWSYLIDILQRFGFCPQFLTMIKCLLHASKYSIFLNGKPCGFFGQTRGIKQGDPLSPLLFIIANEGFSRNINYLFQTGSLGRFNCGRNSIPVTHLAYADDLVIFTNAHTRSVSNLKKFLTKYQQVSGQTINSSKSSFMVGKKFNSLRIRKLEQLLNMPHRKLPFSYLGSPIHSGITRKQHCTRLISSFEKKLNGWYQKNLDQAGRLILINHVLNTIPNYFLAANTLPKTITNLLHQKMTSFWWGGGKKNHHWLKWETLSLPKKEGGIGTRDFHALEEAFSLKLWWKFHHNNSLWGRFMKAKYQRNGEMECHLVDSPIWTRISRINTKALNHCHITEEESFIWNEDQTRDFTLGSAYEICRPKSNPSFAFQCIWESPKKSKISIFMWKLLRKCLPIPDNLRRLGFSLPSMCPFCRNSSLSAKHCLIDCDKIVDIWRYFAGCLNFLHTESPTINQHFMNWWLRNTPNLYGLLQKDLPGIITWHIWKKMNEIIYGDCHIINVQSLIHQVASYTKQWLSIKTLRKLQHFDSWLFNHNLIPRFTTNNSVRMVKWMAPPKGRLKLNVDASYTIKQQRGAAILRDAEGRLVRGASFKLNTKSAYQAEVEAAIKAIKWALQISNSLVFETDARSIISRIPKFK
ncbi:unnamed protein product [Cuscuta campestris]|uniref:Reverse transcriptase domain-containing protein n=1 Tax=Cuscuta campestris TaxID=132261 RepID=A0A484M973_9ASTE|nr:unnamed protein product [Cuscuta campestris]